MTPTTVFIVGLLLGVAFALGVTALLVLLDTIPKQPELVLGQGACSLTAREQEVVRMIVQGFSSKQIAPALGISVHTVYNHRRSIYEKLDVHNVGALVRVALEKEIA